jgi:hypothetical protein
MANESNVDEILKMAGEQTTHVMNTQPILGYIILGLAAVILVLIAAVIIVMLFRGTARDRIAGLLFEVGADGQRGKPSVSRLQMLIWNFVVAFAFLYLLGTRGNVYASIQALFQWQVLTLLGISNGTYLFGKRLRQGSATPQASTRDTTMTESGGQPVAAGEAAATGPGPQGTQ